tara:strand:+ start:319 stop:1011 length:693 start_codon:yes stop_codon:yes gene_type:complete
MKCAIMQPHYFPWSGYFNLIFKSDKFIFLDDAQYSKGSWHSKNFIVVNNQKYTLSVPLVKSPLSTKIKDKIIDQKNNWKKKQVKTISQSYSRHEFSNDLNELLDFFYNFETFNLSRLNIEIIKYISNKLNIKNDFLCSSEFNFKEKRTKKILKILKKINAKEYLSAAGAEKYLKDDNFLQLSDINLVFNNFVAARYNQSFQKKFVQNLSIVDVIANLGWKNTEDYVKSNK